MRVIVDSNCLVAAALPQHEHHAATLAELARRRAAGQTLIMAAHALVEAYAVLTRLPPPHRLSSHDAWAILDRNWGASAAVALTAAESWRMLRQQAAGGLIGGRVYDGIIAACAKKAKADELLTWNTRHYGVQPETRVLSPVQPTS